MLSINLKDAKAGFSNLVDEAIKGEFVTITRHGKPVAALVSLEAAEIARKAMERKRSGLGRLPQDVPWRQLRAQPLAFAGCGLLSGFLLDTNVISMLSPFRTEASPSFVEWLERIDGEGRIFLSVVTIHEIEKGIALLDHKGAVAKAAGLRLWLAGLVAAYDDRILVADTLAAALAGQLEARAIASGFGPGMADALIAGIAKAHDCAIVTCNARHFVPFGLTILSPDDAAASSGG